MKLPTDAELLASIDAFLARHEMAVTRFGAEATGEPQLLSTIRDKGRSPSLKVWRRIASFMERKDAELAAVVHADVDSVAIAIPAPGKSNDLTASVPA